MSYNAKNYTEQGGEKTVIGGELEIREGAQVTGLPSSSGESGNELNSEFPEVFENYYLPPLSTTADTISIVQHLESVKHALISAGILAGTKQSTFNYMEDFTLTEPVLLANRNASTRTYDAGTKTLTIECNPSDLQEEVPNVEPYSGFMPHKYVMAAFDIGDRTGSTVQVNRTIYYSSNWENCGCDDSYVYCLIAVDQLKAGLNKNALLIQMGNNEIVYVDVEFKPKG